MEKEYSIIDQKDNLETDKPVRSYVISVLSEDGDEPSKNTRIDIPIIFNKKLKTDKFNNPINYFIKNNIDIIEKTSFLSMLLIFTILSITIRDLKFFSPIILFFMFYFYKFVRTYKNNREKYFEENTHKTIDERKMKINLDEFIKTIDLR